MAIEVGENTETFGKMGVSENTETFGVVETGENTETFGAVGTGENTETFGVVSMGKNIETLEDIINTVALTSRANTTSTTRGHSEIWNHFEILENKAKYLYCK